MTDLKQELKEELEDAEEVEEAGEKCVRIEWMRSRNRRIILIFSFFIFLSDAPEELCLPHVVHVVGAALPKE